MGICSSKEDINQISNYANYVERELRKAIIGAIAECKDYPPSLQHMPVGQILLARSDVKVVLMHFFDKSTQLHHLLCNQDSIFSSTNGYQICDLILELDLFMEAMHGNLNLETFSTYNIKPTVQINVSKKDSILHREIHASFEGFHLERSYKDAFI